MKKLNLVFLAAALSAWEGYDWDKGDYVEIEKGNLVRSGRDIKIYDYSDDEYKDVEVQSIRKTYGGKVEVEVLDLSSGETRTLEMDGYEDRKRKAGSFDEPLDLDDEHE